MSSVEEKNAVARPQQIRVRMSGQPILCKLQEHGMSQRSGQLPQPIEVGWCCRSRNRSVTYTHEIKVQATSRESFSSLMCNYVIHVELTMNPLRGEYICGSQSERDRIHWPSLDKLHLNVRTDACLLWTSSCCTSSIKCLQPFYGCFEFKPRLKVCVTSDIQVQ